MDALQGCLFVGDKLKHIMCEELRCFSKEFHATGAQHLAWKWKECVDNEGDLLEK
jgi:hypothetical protein